MRALVISKSDKNLVPLFRMVTCQEKALENLKLGLFDVLPAGSLDGLTAEDFRLLLNGVSIHAVQLKKTKPT